MSHELEDNKERRYHILAKMRQYPNGLPLQKLKSMIMDEFGYNLRGAADKVKELQYMSLIKERNLLWFPADAMQSHALKREEGRRRVTKGSVQEESTRQEET